MRTTTMLLILALGLAPSRAGAETPVPLPKVGFLVLGKEAAAREPFTAFSDGLGALGWIDGRTIVLRPRWADGVRARVPDLVRGFIAEGAGIIVATGPTVHDARRAIGATPIVFSFSGDPVLAGLVKSMAKPGGNMTGVSFMSYELNEKRLDILREALPAVSRVALMSDPQHPGEHLEVRANFRAAERLGITLVHVQVDNPAKLDAGLDRVRRSGVQAMLVLPDATMTPNRARIAQFAARVGIPMISGWAMFAKSGALMTYGPNLSDSYRRLGYYVDQILKGARPADLPVEQPTEFQLVVNLRTAKALGVAIPSSILLRADEVIE